MKKLLIISYYFSPMSVIGAVRWTKLAKYLSLSGYDVTVLTSSAKAPEDQLLINDAGNINRIIRIDHGNSRFDCTIQQKDVQTAAAISQNNGRRSVVRRIKDAIWRSRLLRYPTSVYATWQDYSRSADFFRQVKKYIKANLDINEFDAVISTYGPTADSLIGQWLKKSYPKTPLIMDFRDPMTCFATPFPYRQRYRNIQRGVCRSADRILAVTEGIVPRICDKVTEKKCTVVTNGYDPDDFAGITPAQEKRYCIAYTGNMYGGRADFSPLLRALGELIDNGTIKREDVVLHHIGTEPEKMLAHAAQFGLEDIVETHGRQPRSTALSWQLGTRLLVMYVWNYKTERGVLSGKLLEYMNSGRPVIGLISGDEGDSVLRRTIERGRFGIAHESVTDEVDYPALRDYIAADYRRWQQGLDSELSPDRDYIDGFGYPRLAQRVAELIEAL